MYILDRLFRQETLQISPLSFYQLDAHLGIELDMFVDVQPTPILQPCPISPDLMHRFEKGYRQTLIRLSNRLTQASSPQSILCLAFRTQHVLKAAHDTVEILLITHILTYDLHLGSPA